MRKLLKQRGPKTPSDDCHTLRKHKCNAHLTCTLQVVSLCLTHFSVLLLCLCVCLHAVCQTSCCCFVQSLACIHPLPGLPLQLLWSTQTPQDLHDHMYALFLNIMCVQFWTLCRLRLCTLTRCSDCSGFPLKGKSSNLRNTMQDKKPGISCATCRSMEHSISIHTERTPDHNCFVAAYLPWRLHAVQHVKCFCAVIEAVDPSPFLWCQQAVQRPSKRCERPLLPAGSTAVSPV